MGGVDDKVAKALITLIPAESLNRAVTPMVNDIRQETLMSGERPSSARLWKTQPN